MFFSIYCNKQKATDKHLILYLQPEACVLRLTDNWKPILRADEKNYKLTQDETSTYKLKNV